MVLEGILPDGKVGAILDQFAVPYFRQDKYGAGLVETTKAFRAELLGESFLLPSKSSSADWFKTFIIFLAIAIFVSKQSRRTPPGGRLRQIWNRSKNYLCFTTCRRW